MLNRKSAFAIVCSLMCLMFSLALAGDHPAGGEHPKAAKDHPAKEDPSPSVEEQIAGLETMCTESADARAKRQAAESLFVRMGGEEKVRAFFADVVARHRVIAALQLDRDEERAEFLHQLEVDSDGDSTVSASSTKDLRTARHQFEKEFILRILKSI